MAKNPKIAWNPRSGAAQNARRQLPRLVRKYFVEVRAILAGNPPPAELHAIRLASKRLRYTLELFRTCYGPAFGARLAALQRLQQVLGEVNDCAASDRLIGRLLPPSAAREECQLFLRRRATRKAAEVRQEWHASFDAPGREQWWLGYLARSARASDRKPRL